MKVNKKGFNYAKELINAGKVDNNSDWDFSAEDGNKLLGDDNWGNYGKWFLGVDENSEPETKGHFKFPFGKDGKVYRKALSAIRQRASQFKHTEIFDAAGELFELLDTEEKNINMKTINKRHIDKIEETETHYVIHYLKDEEYEEDEEMVEEVIEEEEVAEGDHDKDMYRTLTKKEGFERRTFTTTEMRLDQDNERRVVGYASVFNSLSENLGGFRELISERAFDNVMEDSVVALINHDMNYPLARTDNNTLTLSVDSKGLRYSFDVPEGLSYGNDLLINLRAGNISQSSFGFIVEEDSWERKDGEHIRTIEKVSRLIDVSPVTIPAYPEATAQVSKVAQRNLNTQKEKHENQKIEQDLHKRNLIELKLKIIKNKKNG
jgi:HK97 family phage prohead protease